jgi:thioredoxin-related protein
MRLELHRLLRLLVAGCIVLAIPLAWAQFDFGPQRDPVEHFFKHSRGDLKAELAAAKQAGKQGLLIMYLREDCAACERMLENVLARTLVQEEYGRNFHALAIDAQGAKPLNDFAGKPTTERAFASRARVATVPAVAFYDLSGRLLYAYRGEILAPVEMIALERFMLDGEYRRITFDQYKHMLSSKKGR